MVGWPKNQKDKVQMGYFRALEAMCANHDAYKLRYQTFYEILYASQTVAPNS